MAYITVGFAIFIINLLIGLSVLRAKKNSALKASFMFLWICILVISPLLVLIAPYLYFIAYCSVFTCHFAS
ncbi:hypothetical protein DM558_05150 [Entomomonas moraniae]|uniref:Uncharacterized protein n=1 Tax=Entomomonas moraniae TaxID=2213226 RepID=A0A3S9XCP2_9GAMM|nr:hypothetical protein DM558_05150 [Entomomonas moraniae]